METTDSRPPTNFTSLDQSPKNFTGYYVHNSYPEAKFGANPPTGAFPGKCVKYNQNFIYYIRQVNGVKLANIMFSLLGVYVSVCTQSHWFEWAE